MSISTLDVQAFVRRADLSLKDLQRLRKCDLTAIAQYLNVEVTQGLKKAEILDLLASHMELKEETQTSDQAPISNQADIELAKLKLEMEKERMRLEFEERKLTEQREAEAEEKQKQRETEMEMKRLEMEQELRLRELELAHAQATPTRERTSPTFDLAKNIRLVPKFEEDRIDSYFVSFEKVANSLKWPQKFWPMLLQSVFVGKAADVYSSLSEEQSCDYATVKKVILNAYELVPEAYRHKFRNTCRKPGHTHVEFAREKEMMFDRWYRSLKVDQDFDNLREVVLLEEFKKSVTFSVRSHLDDHKVTNVQKAAMMADEYELTHKNDNRPPFRNFSGKRDKFQSSAPKNPGSGKDAQGKGDSTTSSPPAPKTQLDKPANQRPNVPTCFYCGKKGHLKSQCWKLQNKEKKDMGFVMSKSVLPENSVPVNDTQAIENHSQKFDDRIKQVNESYRSFLFDGEVTPCMSGEAGTPVVILRDTGATQSLMVENGMSFPPDSAVNAKVLIQTVDGNYMSVPLYRVDLKCDLVSGPVTVGVVPELPMAGIDFLLGNDLAGDKVVVSPVVSEKPVEVAETEQLQVEFPGIFPDCVVTRSQARRATQDDADAVDVEENSGVWLAETFFKGLNDGDADAGSVANSGELFSKSSLVEAQQADSELKGLFQTACSEAEAEKVAECYYVKDGMLMRKWRPPLRPADEDWTVVHQVVVPPTYRKEILRIAHELPVGGHLGVRKTKDRIMRHFYWPKLSADVAEFCRTCHTCQVVGKPQPSLKPAPLIPIPAFDEPFSRVLVDCVGPLPKTRSGHKYLLTIMDMSSRFPEAIPLRNITAKTVVEALVQFFTRYGLPKEVQSDQGSNFMSGLFQEVMYRLGVKQLKSSAYHPQSQGALERYHQTLKIMIRAFCEEYPEDWDKGIPFLLFASRDSPNESTGFSPFELVYGHEVRGPLKLIKERFMAQDDDVNLLDYVSKFRERLTKACEVAREHLKTSQDKMKKNADKNAKARSFKPGDKVLVLLPLQGEPLKAKFSGPYCVKKKLNDVNYVISTPDRRKEQRVCHVNMLKEYFEREASQPVGMTQVVDSEVEVGVDSDDTGMSESDVKGSEPSSARLSNTERVRTLDETKSNVPQSQTSDVTFRAHQHKDVHRDYLGCMPNPLAVFVSLTSEHLPMFNQSHLTGVRVGVT